MSNSRFEDFWKIMKAFDFTEHEELNSDLLCIICNKIMINAHNGPCGCRYCLTCIIEYLDGKEKMCPGHTEDCKVEFLDVNKNIFVDQPVNVKISKVHVKCPEMLCEFRDELRRIGDHLRLCNLRSVNCPYFHLGCKENQIPHDRVEEHLRNEVEMHTRLLMDSIDNLQNDVDALKANIADLKVENSNLRAELKELQLNKDKTQ